MRSQWVGLLQVVLGSLGFGFLGIFGKWAFQSGLSVGELLTYRFIIAAALLFLFLLLFDRKKIDLSISQIFISAGLGIFGYALFATLYFTAIQGMSVGLAALLLYTYPFWVSLFSHFLLKDKMSGWQWLLLLGAFVGVTCLLWGQFHVQNRMALLAGLGSAISYAAYILVSHKYQKSVTPISSSLYVMTFAAVALALYHRPPLHFWNFLSAHQWWILLGISTVATILPMTLILAGLQKLNSAQVAVISMLEPVTAVVVAHLLFHESMSSLQVIGAVMVLICLTLRMVTMRT
jgi:drug/metabolite transporter (DMT)-like permease